VLRLGTAAAGIADALAQSVAAEDPVGERLVHNHRSAFGLPCRAGAWSNIRRFEAAAGQDRNVEGAEEVDIHAVKLHLDAGGFRSDGWAARLRSRLRPPCLRHQSDALCLDPRGAFVAGIDHRERYARDTGLVFQQAHQLGLPAREPPSQLACAGGRSARARHVVHS
jgi:hypothetical protein